MDNLKSIFLFSLFALFLAILFSYDSVPFLVFMNNTVSHHQVPSTNNFGSQNRQSDDHHEVYIVHVRQPQGSDQSINSPAEWAKWHSSFLPSTNLAFGERRLIYSYSHAISGFAARLTPKEVRDMESKDGFVGAHPSRRHTLHTTYTPRWLGLERGDPTGLWEKASYGKGIIIGVLDSGIDGSHPSFRDDDMPPKPPQFGGTCWALRFNCNKKIIGAIGFKDGDWVPADDYDDHGTNTAGIAAGNFVAGAEFFGNAKGTAAGTAPHAHLAIYKVCHCGSCHDHDILAGIDQAMADKVDVLSMSIGHRVKWLHESATAKGSFRATSRGILVSAAAGNSGPWQSTVENDAPWVLTVGASTVNRTLRGIVKLGNGEELFGESAMKEGELPSLPLVYPGANGDLDAIFCRFLDKYDVKGRVVMCNTGGGISNVDKSWVVRQAGGAALILMNRGGKFTTFASAHHLPAIHVSFLNGLRIQNYVKNSQDPRAGIKFEGTKYGTPISPTVAEFSGRGPSEANGGILKPDIIGPGVNILSPSNQPYEPEPPSTLKFNMVSGTSMSTPHLAGIMALLKVSHPDWPPAAIKSAIMTSATHLNSRGEPIMDETDNDPANLFAMGSGHVYPAKANDPGLVYDIETNDYIGYLCGLGYSDSEVYMFTHQMIRCSEVAPISADQLNYPTFAVFLRPGETRTVRRTVTNVGDENSGYRVYCKNPPKVKIEIIFNQGKVLCEDSTSSAATIRFSQLNQKESFTVSFKVDAGGAPGTFSEGVLVFYYDKYIVRSPISVGFLASA